MKPFKNEMVQGPCAHVGLHDQCWFHKFIKLLSLHRDRDIRHQTQHSRLYSYHGYWIYTNFRSIAGVVTKRALLMDPDELWPLWPWKVGQIKNPGIMSCIPIRWTHHKNLELIPSLVQEFYHFMRFSFGPLVTQVRQKFCLSSHLT
jgi:hypothetical protein